MSLHIISTSNSFMAVISGCKFQKHRTSYKPKYQKQFKQFSTPDLKTQTAKMSHKPVIKQNYKTNSNNFNYKVQIWKLKTLMTMFYHPRIHRSKIHNL